MENVEENPAEPVPDVATVAEPGQPSEPEDTISTEVTNEIPLTSENIEDSRNDAAEDSEIIVLAEGQPNVEPEVTSIGNLEENVVVGETKVSDVPAVKELVDNFAQTFFKFMKNLPDRRADQDYDMGPATEMMVNDFDDERTLDEEEALEGSEDSHNELSNLQKEGDMPLKDLLAMYGYGDPSTENSNSSDQMILPPGGEAETEAQSSDKGDNDADADDDDDADPMSNEPDLKQFYTEMVKGDEADGVDGEGVGEVGSGSSRLLRSVSRPQSEEEEDDCDYSPDEEEWKKTIMVGSDYQAAIPEGLCRYDDALPYENEDKMLWDPSHIPQEETEEFLERAQLPAVKGSSLPTGSHIRDDEQALYLLLQCGYNLEEALRRRRMNVVPPTDAVSLWSEEECHNFETGLRSYGKDFHLIQKNKVRTRSVGELVQFYYLWKKTERHDIFTYKARLEKKKYALHPGITDYMDRFLEEQEGVRDRSSSPNIHCLLYGDAKRQRSSANSTNNEDSKLIESWDSGGAVDPLADLNNLPPSSVTMNSNSLPVSGTPHHLDYATHMIHEGTAENNALWTSSHTHSNNHVTSGTMEMNDSPSPENILPHLPP